MSLRSLFCFLCLAVVILPGVAPLRGQDRAALVICQDAYPAVTISDLGKLKLGPLITPRQNKVLASASLRQAGFQVTVAENLTTVQLRTALRSFAKAHAGCRNVLFYFSGHGMQVDGVNYLTGVDSDLDIAAEVQKISAGITQGFFRPEEKQARIDDAKRAKARQQMLPLTEVITALCGMRPGEDSLRMILLDACRSPYGETEQEQLLLVSQKSGITIPKGSGLSTVSVEKAGLFIGFAALANQVANQNENETQPSLYSQKLFPALLKPGVNFLTAFNDAGVEVRRASLALAERNSSQYFEQIPAQYSAVVPEFIFIPAKPVLIPPDSDQIKVRSPQAERVINSYWDHNGSVMGLVVSGNTRKIVYIIPRKGLEGLVKKWDLLYEGSVTNGKHMGYAKRFIMGRPPNYYKVQGFAKNEKLFLSGIANLRDDNGHFLESISDELIFTYLKLGP